MINEIKSKIISLKGKKLKILVDVGRNKNEVYEGIITDTYSNVWLFKTNYDIKSFSYNDILIKNVVISS